MQPLRILLVDDHVLFRQGVEFLLNAHQDFEVVGSASDGREAIEFAHATQPDVILMDIEMPGCDGLAALQQIKHDLPEITIVMLTVVDNEDTIFEAIKRGAQGYLLKDLDASELYDMLQELQKGNAPLSGKIAAQILNEFKHPPKPKTDMNSNKLSKRELAVLELLVTGDTTWDIAQSLGISENTVRAHLRKILEKLHLNNRVQAAVYAVQHELVDTSYVD